MNSKEKNAARAARNRAIVEAARAGGCVDCGLMEIAIIEFDHVPERGPKAWSIGVMVASGRGAKLLREELAKCDPVCPNCHRRRTLARLQFGGRSD